jgi:hypothetical protein
VGRGYVQEGKNLHYVKALHCEFEGNGIYLLLNLLIAVLALLVAALAFWPVAILAAIIALLFLLFRVILGNPGQVGSGNPLDVNPNLGSLDKGDVVVVKGEWIYDSLHAGWNEIHPVRACQKIGRLEMGQKFKDFSYTDQETQITFTLDSIENVKTFRDFWCGMLKGAEDAENGGSKDNPQHDWGIHPTVDGCKPPDIIL